jgi:predicted metal-dependent hydrolase
MPHDQDEELAGLSPEELLQLGVDRFNAGLYFEAHEAWEEVWLGARRELREFYQGLIQVAAAFVHLSRTEYPGTVKLLHAGLQKLERYPADQFGVDLASLIAAARQIEVDILRLGEKRLEQIDASSLPRIGQLGR